jgi:hypothetical protein
MENETPHERVDVKLLLPGGRVREQALYLTYGDSYGIELDGLEDAGEGHRFEDVDFFDCLKQLRIWLQGRGIRPLCNGARRNAFVSGMSSQMGAGRLAYLVTPGQVPREEDLVDIFGEAAPADVVTVEEQEAFIRQWYDGAIGRSDKH